MSTEGDGYIPRAMIALCYGTRPQIIKASVLRRALARLGPVHAVDTGQHYDHALNALLYQELGVDPPHRFLEVGSGSHAEQIALMLTRADAVLRELRPRVAVVIGDTNSTLGTALAATRLGLPVVHVEAGLRSRNRLMAEEQNRRAVDAMASLLCTPSAAATARMQVEHPAELVRETGDVAYDVLLGARERLPAASSVVPGLPASYIFSTLHRAELVDDEPALMGILRALAAIGTPAIFAAHPRTRATLARAGVTQDRIGLLRIISPVGYLECLALTAGARAVVTDSGGLQREAYWLGVPCITVRAETEWEETVEAEANRLVPPGDAPRRLAEAVTAQVGRWNGESRWPARAYGDGHAALAVATAVEALLS
ncbi:MAG TPA: UDP-N-acetyl glucosamine 2-epimerase [Gemmatimonadales bacterium]|nr:UDP-N-acetyl glucosamine 2-epimerase [Gemmatimonadales bacterium]